MSVTKEIKSLLKEEFKEFERVFKSAMNTDVALLDIILKYLHKQKGKQMRPMFVMLTSHIYGGITPATYRAASLIELLHTATLVHDDVVDDANERRGLFSLNALWKNKVSVLAGDFLLSKGLILSLEHDDFELLKIVSNATKEMSEGELLQIEKARRLDITEEVYFEIIRKKTASLIASCCAVGAASQNTSKQEVERMRLFGEKVGLAFQIKDDIFDFKKSGDIGKPKGIDIKEQKMTLPLIYMLNNMSVLEKRRVINIIKRHHRDPKKVEEVIDLVNSSGGIAYAEAKMNELVKETMDLLSDFPDSVYLESLKKLVNYSISRKR
jgi:octaprenyl-diphosphate synthase